MTSTGVVDGLECLLIRNHDIVYSVSTCWNTICEEERMGRVKCKKLHLLSS